MKGSSWKVNSIYLVEVKEQIQGIWDAQPPQNAFFIKLHKFGHFYRQYRLAQVVEIVSRKLCYAIILYPFKLSFTGTYIMWNIKLRLRN